LNYVLGFGGLTPTARNVALISGEGLRLFPGTPWGVLAPAVEHFQIAAAGASLGANCLRTGMEDTFRLPNGDIAPTNADLVAALVKVVRNAGREIATPAEARVMLGLV
jgi:uncharacterized protein (DUF849 family)